MNRATDSPKNAVNVAPSTLEGSGKPAGARPFPKFEPRIRFNWGFHDAQANMESGGRYRDVSRHFDKAYAQGYEAGRDEFRLTRVRNESSEQAWKARG